MCIVVNYNAVWKAPHHTYIITTKYSVGLEHQHSKRVRFLNMNLFLLSVTSMCNGRSYFASTGMHRCYRCIPMSAVPYMSTGPHLWLPQYAPLLCPNVTSMRVLMWGLKHIQGDLGDTESVSVQPRVPIDSCGIAWLMEVIINVNEPMN